MFSKGWNRLSCSREELNLDVVLGCGQAFRWRHTEEGVWTGIIGKCLWLLKQEDKFITYSTRRGNGTEQDSSCCTPKKSTYPSETLMHKTGRKQESPQWNIKATKALLRIPQVQSSSPITDISMQNTQCTSNVDSSDTHTGVTSNELNSERVNPEDLASLKDYLQLSTSLKKLYEHWSAGDPQFERVLKGIRVLRQDPVECLIAFICSSNNNIPRISLMMNRISQEFGDVVAERNGLVYHSFPTLESLSGQELKLRELGCGYRARYISESATIITRDKGGRSWLDDLRGRPYQEAKEQLLTLPGVGNKVADCVLLMSLDCSDSLPVDVHVFNLVKRDYMTQFNNFLKMSSCANAQQKSGKSSTSTSQELPTENVVYEQFTSSSKLSEKSYHLIGDFFRHTWGHYAGWAQAVLFASDVMGQSETKKRQKSSQSQLQNKKRRQSSKKDT